MKLTGLAALPLLLALGATPPAGTAISYQLSPGMRGGSIEALDVTIRLRADRSGTTTIDWADEWAGERKLGRWARNIRVTGGRVAGIAPNGGRIVRSAGGAPLVMRYRIVSAHAEDPTARHHDQAPPIIRPGWFYTVGEVLYARPTGREDAPARFAWEGPAGIGFASDTEHARGPRDRGLAVGDIMESIAIGGRDLAVTTMRLNGAPIRIAHVGRFGFDVQRFDALAQRIVAVERDFWRDRDAGPFLITAIPLVPVSGLTSYGGTGRSDAFATWIDRDADLSRLAWLLAHEYFHSWNARQLGGFPPGKAAERYWLSEGFTDFYARRLMLRAGISTPEQFAAEWNEMLRAYAVSPMRATGNVAAAAKYWSGDYAAEKLPYQRGAMLAAWWDLQLRARGTADLDTVLRAQRDRVRDAAEKPDLVAAFADEMTRAGLDIRGQIARHVTGGELITLPEDAFGRCTRVVTADMPVFERGWDSEATAKAGNVFAGVDPGSNAYAAGLRDGMKLVGRRAGEPGNAAVDYVLEVTDGPTTRTLTFRPAGRATARTQQIVLDPARFRADPEGCRRALAG